MIERSNRGPQNLTLIASLNLDNFTRLASSFSSKSGRLSQNYLERLLDLELENVFVLVGGMNAANSWYTSIYSYLAQGK